MILKFHRGHWPAKAMAGLACALLAAALTGCGAPEGDTAQSSLDQFFENSERRDADDAEKLAILNVPSGCTAFFVANTAGKTYVGSARHCFNYNITSWCQNGGTFKDHAGESGRCQRIVAADATHDIAIVEAKFSYVPGDEATLELASYEPAVGTQLKMIGFPADKYRRGKLTVTENCWVLKQTTRSPHGGSLGDRSSLHNCSTYGGNSGGPMIASRSRTVIGLPFTYQPNDYRLRSSESLSTAAHLAQMADLVSTHRSELEAAGVVISDQE